jgi:hypothetical protein
MALKLKGEADSTIMKIGRWSGTTYLTYILSQSGALNAGLAARMAVRIHFGKRQCHGTVKLPHCYSSTH